MARVREALIRLKRRFRPLRPSIYEFVRLTEESIGSNELTQAMNVLSYTKVKSTWYSGAAFPAGYHTIDLNGVTILGQRSPASRLSLVPYDFSGKRVLDVGSNQGGMLHAMDGKLAWGIGIDVDPVLTNAANRVAHIRKDASLAFYTFDLERDPLPLLEDFLPGRPDVVFLLAVCAWISNWREVVQYMASVSGSLLFETNGTEVQQQAQIDLLKTLYGEVTLLASSSNDDRTQQLHRKLLWCQDATK